MKLLRCVLAILACAWLNGAAALQPGERLAPWTLLDQFDRPYSLDQSLQVLLVARGMEASERLQEALAELAPGFLERHRVTFLADISGMPRPVASLFAVPAMRDYDYRVILDRSGRVASRYPGDKAELLWLRLEEGRLVERRVFLDAEVLRQALAELAP